MNNAFDLPTQLSRASTIQGPLAWREQTQADTALDQEFGPKSPEQQDGPLVNTENVDVPTIEEPRYRVEIKGTSADEKPSRRR